MVKFQDRTFFLIQALLRYFPFRLGTFLRRLLYKPFFKSFGKQITIHDGVIIKYPSEIELEGNVTLNQYCYIVGKGGLRIGSYTLVGAGCKIVTTSHLFENRSIPIAQQLMSSEKIYIEGDVWLGFNVIILQGVHIARGTIIAAGSVVKKGKYEEYSILGGVPAKLIRKRP